MNANLNKLEKWLNELAIKNIAQTTCLMVDREELADVAGDQDVSSVLKEVSTKFFISSQDEDWFYVDSF